MAEEEPDVPYGPDNTWPRAMTSEIPGKLGRRGTGFEVGDVLPNATLIDQHGDEVEMYPFYGQPILLDIMAIWCGSCRGAAPSVDRIYADLAEQGVMVIAAVQENHMCEAPARFDLMQWVEAYDITHPVLADGDGAYRTIVNNGPGYPTFALIGPDMRILDAQYEGMLTADGVTAALEEAGVW